MPNPGLDLIKNRILARNIGTKDTAHSGVTDKLGFSIIGMLFRGEDTHGRKGLIGVFT